MPGGGVLWRLVESAKPSLGEALEEAVEEAAGRLGGEAEELAAAASRALEEAMRRGVLRETVPIRPPVPPYGVDGGLARVRRGSRVLAVLHAVALGYGFERHLVRVLLVPAAGPEADAAVEAVLSLLEAAAVAATPPGSLVFLDGPVADPPWAPARSRVLEAVAEQALGSREAVEALTGLHEARAEAMRDRVVVGVVKRLTGESMLSGLLGLGEVQDDVLAAAMAAVLRARGAGAAAMGPMPLRGGVYEPYRRLGGVDGLYLLDPRGPRGYRVETVGVDPVEAAGYCIAEAVPPTWLPEEIVAAHRLAKPPVGLVKAALRAAAARLAGSYVGEAAYAVLNEKP